MAIDKGLYSAPEGIDDSTEDVIIDMEMELSPQ